MQKRFKVNHSCIRRTSFLNMLHTLDQISNTELGNIKKRNDFYAVNLFVNSEKDGSVPFYFQTPKMKLSSTLVKGQSSIEVDCDNETFIKQVESVDQYILDIVKSKKVDWFPNQEISDSFLEIGLMSSVSRSNTMKLKVSPDNVIYGNDKSLLEKLDTGREVKFIVQICGLWFTKSRWGISWMIVQSKDLSKKPLIINECLFPDDEQTDHGFVEPPPEINDESIP